MSKDSVGTADAADTGAAQPVAGEGAVGPQPVAGESAEGAQPAAGEGSEGAQLVAEDIAEGAEVAAEVGVAAVAVSDEMLSEQVVPILEAVLYAAEEPVPVTEIVEVLAKVGKERDREWANGVSVLLVGRLAILLSDRLLRSGSALQVLEVAGGFRLGTRPRFDPWIRALRQVERPSRLSIAALETLAVVAYRQPVTMAEIAAVPRSSGPFPAIGNAGGFRPRASFPFPRGCTGQAASGDQKVLALHHG